MTMIPDRKQIETLVADAVSRIGEHAESVVIIVTSEGPT